MLDTDHIGRMPHGSRCRVDSRPADGMLEERNADRAAGGGDAAQLVVPEIAGVVAGSANSGVRHDDRLRRNAQGLIDDGRRGVRQVERHSGRLHPADQLTTEVGQAALAHARR